MQIDKHCVHTYNSNNEITGIDHKASAKANLKQAGADLFGILPFDKFFQTLGDEEDTHYKLIQDGFEKILGNGTASLFIGMAVTEVLDLVIHPILAAKNVTDAAVHGVLAGVESIRGE